MKFVLASVPVFVGKTVVFDPSTVMVAGALPPVNVIIRVSKGKDYVLIDNSIDGTNAKGNLKWTLTVQTSFNEDTGT